MKGVILCGGKSSRMGADKGLLKQDDQTWSQIATQKLIDLHLSVFVSINHQQKPAYSKLFGEHQLIPDRDDLHIGGPLLGLLSAHLQFPNDDLFVLACDMRDVSTRLLLDLLNNYNQGNYQALVFSTQHIHQPLCGIYSAPGLANIHTLLRQQQLQKVNMMHVLEKLDASFIPVQEKDLPYFVNYNTPEEFTGLSISTNSSFDASHKGQP